MSLFIPLPTTHVLSVQMLLQRTTMEKVFSNLTQVFLCHDHICSLQDQLGFVFYPYKEFTMVSSNYASKTLQNNIAIPLKGAVIMKGAIVTIKLILGNNGKLYRKVVKVYFQN